MKNITYIYSIAEEKKNNFCLYGIIIFYNEYTYYILKYI